MNKEALSCCHGNGDDLYIVVLTLHSLWEHQWFTQMQNKNWLVDIWCLNLEWTVVGWSMISHSALRIHTIAPHSCSVAQSASDFQFVDARCPRAAYQTYISALDGGALKWVDFWSLCAVLLTQNTLQWKLLENMTTRRGTYCVKEKPKKGKRKNLKRREGGLKREENR